MGKLAQAAVILVGLVAVLYQFIVKDLIFHTFGYGRELIPFDTFFARCARIVQPGLEACEDMWMHEPSGMLYMACSDAKSRRDWLPAMNHLNASGRSLTDRIAVYDTRADGAIESHIKWITPEGFGGINGDGTMNLHGLSVRAVGDQLKIVVNNHRPPIDPVTGAALDAVAIGANSTFEVFTTTLGSSTMQHVKTYVDPLIDTPNRPAWVSDDAFVFTNDNSAKVGLRRKLDPILGGGSVVYCDAKSCHTVHDSGFHFPNGLIQGHDGLIYVPNTFTGNIDVFSLTPDKKFEKIQTIKSPLPLDNLSVDGNGDLFGAAFPKLHLLEASEEVGVCPSAVLKISKTGKAGGKKSFYHVKRVVEDDGKKLPGSTVAVHDIQTGNLYMGGVHSPWITICETRMDE